MGANVGTAYVTIQPSMKGFASSISGEVSSVGSSAGTQFSSTFKASGVGKIGAAMGAVAGVAGKVATAAFSAIGNSMGNAISRVDTLANFPKVMSNLGYSSEEASASIQRISKSLDGLPSSTDNVASMVQQLAPMCSSLSEATDLGLALNNMFLAGGASAVDCSRAMQQYTQILNKGKPDLQDWKTLQEVMPGQLNQVAQALLGAGSSSTDLYNALKDGSLTMDDFNNAVMKLNTEGVDGFASFEQQAKDATQGIATALDNVQNRISSALAKLINAFGENRISGAINAFSGSFGTIADRLVPAFTLLGNASEAFANKMSSSLAKAKEDFNNALGGKIVAQLNTATSAFSASADTIKTRFSVMGQTMRDTFQSVINQIQSGSLRLSSLTTTFSAIKTSLAGIFDDTPAGEYVAKVRAKLEQLVAPIGNGNFFQSLFGENFGTLPAGLQAMFTSLDSGLQNVSQLASSAGASLSNFWNTVSSKLSTVNIDFNGISTSLMNGLGTALEMVTPKIQAIAEFIKTTFGAVVEFVQTVATGISEAFGSFNVDSLAVLANFATLITPMGLLKETLVQIGGTLSGTISGVLQALAPLVVSIVQTALNLIESLAPSLGSLASIISSTLATGINVISTVLQAITPIIQIVVGLISQIMPVLATLAGSVLTTLSTVLATVFSTVTQVVAGVLPTVLSLIQMLTPFIQQLATIIAQLVVALTPIITQLVSMLLPVIESIMQAVQPLVLALMNLVTAVMPIIQSVLTVIMSLITALLPIIVNIISVVGSIATAIIPVITTIITIVSQIISVVINVVATIISTVTPIVSFIAGVIATIISVIGDVLNVVTGIVASVASVVSSIIQTVSRFVSSVVSAISSFVSQIVGFFVDLVSGVTTKVSSMWNDVVNTFSNGVNDAVNFVRGIPDSIANIFSNAGTLLINSGKSIIDGLVDGIKSAASGAVSAVTDVVANIRNLFPFSPAKEGPFSGHGYTTYSGRALMKGFAEGITSETNAVKEQVSNMLASINSAMNSSQMQFSLATTAEAYKGTYAVQYSNSRTDTLMGALNVLNNNIQAQTKAIKTQEQQIFLDGKTLVGKTAPRMEKELNKRALQGAR